MFCFFCAMLFFIFCRDMKPYKWTSELSDTDSNRLWKISEVWTRLDNYRQSVFGNVQPSHKTTKS